MKGVIVIAAACLIGLGGVPAANAAGCIRGAMVGGVAGHVAGHHGLLGAAAGCAVGHHMARVDAQRARQQQYNSPQGNYDRGNYDRGGPAGNPNGSGLQDPTSGFGR